MREESLAFLNRLLDAPGPSGYEAPAARVWREYATRYAAEVRTDLSGNTIARLNPGATGPRVLLAGHIDQIGLLVTHVNGDGTLAFRGIGGWDDQVLTGQRVRIVTRGGPLLGVIGRAPAHSLKGEQDKAASIAGLFIDIGVDDAASATERVRPGDPAVIEQPTLMLTEDRIAARGLDNRAGAFVAAETLRLLTEEGASPCADVYAVATVAEEIGSFRGARAVTTALQPEIAFALDVTFATDRPGSDEKESGAHPLGSGPAIARGGPTNGPLAELLIETATAHMIPYTIEALPRSTGTDADGIAVAGAGTAVAVVSFPNRYMHSPNEVCSLADLEASARLLAATIRAITPATDFTPR